VWGPAAQALASQPVSPGLDGGAPIWLIAKEWLLGWKSIGGLIWLSLVKFGYGKWNITSLGDTLRGYKSMSKMHQRSINL
jgi:hypothetical protein